MKTPLPTKPKSYPTFKSDADENQWLWGQLVKATSRSEFFEERMRLWDGIHDKERQLKNLNDEQAKRLRDRVTEVEQVLREALTMMKAANWRGGIMEKVARTLNPAEPALKARREERRGA
ncbi:MAG TPA: hypothetical protein VH413_16405 [Verrucomicrobiae bacterium]|jgi:hypothetical protein|nr:hypothetical protein [Verrucomicrobiae bacterium]